MTEHPGTPVAPADSNPSVENDIEFEEVLIEAVENGSIKRADGWSFFIPEGADVVVMPGMTARFYGRGIGYMVRGLFVDGVKVFYRTAEEDKQHHLVETYGATAADWLARWDSGRSVWTIEMGGLGPGYEQCIHITAAEILRHMLAEKYDIARWADVEKWAEDRTRIETFGFADKTIGGLGLSGAQWGAAVNVAANLYQRGPIDCLTQESVKDRLIQVSRNFPGSL